MRQVVATLIAHARTRRIAHTADVLSMQCGEFPWGLQDQAEGVAKVIKSAYLARKKECSHPSVATAQNYSLMPAFTKQARPGNLLHPNEHCTSVTLPNTVRLQMLMLLLRRPHSM
mmetsp:Transcript_67682/g.198103  ORF Transcript_67682/g.198103 Transcript_67682/m.198103 type:complete len:115 (+) Transcript_67682:163-507(+)